MTDSKSKIELEQRLLAITSQVRLAQYWSQSAFGILVLCLVIFLWSINLLSFNFLFFTEANRTILFWISLIVGILSLILGTVFFIGARYAKQMILNILEQQQKK